MAALLFAHSCYSGGGVWCLFWSLEWAAAPHALQEWGGQWNFWYGDWEVILSIQVKALSKQLNNPFWAPRERTLSGNLQATVVWSYVGKFYHSGPQSPQLDSAAEHMIYLVEDFSKHTAGSSEVTPLDCSGHLIIVFSQEVAMIELSLLASVQLEHSYSCYHCIQLSYVHCWCYMWKVKLLFEMSSSRTNMILSQNEKLYSERCRNTALSYKLDIIKANIHHRKSNNNFILPFFKAVSESFIGHKKGT